VQSGNRRSLAAFAYQLHYYCVFLKKNGAAQIIFFSIKSFFLIFNLLKRLFFFYLKKKIKNNFIDYQWFRF
jgi:hypothetical protein